MSRPDHVKCIADNHADNAGKSWCGRDIRAEFHFTGIDHAAMNGRNSGYLVACSDCTKKIVVALSEGQEES